MSSVALFLCAALTPAFIGPMASAQRDFRLPPPDRFIGGIDQIAPTINREQLQNIAVETEVLDIVHRLDSDDFKEREAASDQLRSREDWRLQMYALLAGDSVTVEQRCRLLQVVRNQLVNMPRGALGIEMSPMQMIRGGPLEIKVVDLIAGLPAERVLQVGDRIIAIDGQALFMEEDLQSRVQLKRPGESVGVTVKRNQVDDNGKVVKDENGQPVTQVLTLDIVLGSAELLNRQRSDLRSLSNRVQTSRKIEADAITVAFAPQPEVVAVQGGPQKLWHSDPVDEHPAIVNLLAQQEMLGQQGMMLDRNSDQMRMMREVWRRELSALVEGSKLPGLSPDERARMRRVAERYAELMDAGP